jgi:ATP-dependent DNA helicase RecG
MSSIVPDPVHARQQLRQLVDDVLRRLSAGAGPTKVEAERVDLKEEAGRRDRTGGLLPGTATNPAAAEHLAGEVRCFANTPGGGGIVLGVEDGTWALLGTALDEEWLRQRLDDLTGISPVVEARTLRGARILVLLVAESPDPVEHPDHRLRWRVGDRCVEVDRSEWWRHRADRIGVDPMAAPTPMTADDVRDQALQLARRYLTEGGEELEGAPAVDRHALLTHLGVLRPDSRLTQAGALLLTAAAHPQLVLSRLDVAGGDVIGTFEHKPGTSLLEALAAVEDRLDAYNTIRPASRGFVEAGQRQLPVRAVREAVLNHLTHRDWMQPEPTAVRWVDADAELEVTSPGGFTGGVSTDNVLTTRHSRYPALADLFRALRLVDRQGVGVPRMYQTMLAEGHRVPLIEQIPGPRVRTTLTGEPLLQVLAGLLERVEPPPRRRDVRVAVLLDALLRRPLITLASAARVLQSSPARAQLALEAAETCTADGHPLLSRHTDAWRLEPALASAARAGRYGALPRSGELLWFRTRSADSVRRVALAWLDEHDKVTSGDVAALTGMAQPNASAALSALAVAGDGIARGPGKGRNAHFVAAR